jgi:2-hydroxy-3-keto-5-methylthiopentenyl-1-phosphate phosphatase
LWGNLGGILNSFGADSGKSINTLKHFRNQEAVAYQSDPVSTLGNAKECRQSRSSQ